MDAVDLTFQGIEQAQGVHFSPQERDRLVALRTRVQADRRSQWDATDRVTRRRQRFVRWLVAHGRLSG